MKKEGSKWRLGLFVTIGLVLFAAGVYIIGKQKNLFGSTFRLQTMFRNVNGLEIGNNIRFSGINIGTVDNIELVNDTTVKVELLLEQNVQKFIRKNASASIGSEGLMGDKVIVIAPGTPNQPQASNNDILQSKNPIETEQIMASVRNTASNAEVITGELAQFMTKLNNGNGTLAKLIGDDKLANKLNRTMSNLESSSKGLDENMEAAKHNFLLRPFFRKKEKEAKKKQEELEKKKEQAIKDKQKEAEEKEKKKKD